MSNLYKCFNNIHDTLMNEQMKKSEEDMNNLTQKIIEETNCFMIEDISQQNDTVYFIPHIMLNHHSSNMLFHYTNYIKTWIFEHGNGKVCITDIIIEKNEQNGHQITIELGIPKNK